ncbi:very long-chain-fatty-acid--CoA ligase bubblegum [Nilaparvata lugens]|uniref:very long-chain-fatty-acid--CoA ligase bubblegum n=1 Tax=Nilaparvata lugens TaxID=108931 RepID=UPI00193CE3EC|nr:very long-chain-fatty-acid--CoA ligase bubblegum [Nilaparvata lugens]
MKYAGIFMRAVNKLAYNKRQFTRHYSNGQLDVVKYNFYVNRLKCCSVKLSSKHSPNLVKFLNVSKCSVQMYNVSRRLSTECSNDASAGKLKTVNLSCTENEGPTQILPSEELWTSDPAGRIKIRGKDLEECPPISVPGLLNRTATNYPDRIALALKQPDGKYQEITYKQYEENVRIVAKAFIHLGLERYSSVGIIGFNSPEWFYTDLAAIYAGGFAAGMYTTNSPEACHHCLESSRANLCVVEDDKQLQKILEIKDRLPHLKKIIQYSGKVETPDVLSWEDVLKIGNEQSDDQLNEVLKKIGVNECCTLVYTSGTEGKPKAVMLSHDNLTYDAASLTKHLKVDCNNVEILISYLPLSHVAAQVISNNMFEIEKIYTLQGSLGQTLAETHPTIFLGVPRVWEKIQEKMLALGKQVSSVKRTLASWAKMSALQHHEAALKGHTSESYRFKLYKWLVFDKIKARMGLGQCKAFISAAAPISDDVKRYFMSLDILIIEAFGMSECAGAHTCGDYNKFSLKGVGVTLPGCSTKLDNIKDGEGEICMSGRHVFMGYLGQPDKTKDTIDEGGWLHSGDVGRLDDKGNLFITGRIKEILITAGGENIAPVPIEDTVKHELPVVSNALLIGDKRKFLSILLSLKTEVDEEGKPIDKLTRDVQDWCQDLGAPSQTVSEILADADKLEKVKKALHEGLKRANAKSISRAQHIQKLAILPQDFAVGDELGPTLKVKRPVVYNKYAEIIEEFYKE